MLIAGWLEVIQTSCLNGEGKKCLIAKIKLNFHLGKFANVFLVYCTFIRVLIRFDLIVICMPIKRTISDFWLADLYFQRKERWTNLWFLICGFKFSEERTKEPCSWTKWCIHPIPAFLWLDLKVGTSNYSLFFRFVYSLVDLFSKKKREK